MKHKYRSTCITVTVILFILKPHYSHSYNFNHEWDPFHSKYSHFSEKERLQMVEESRSMFQFGYDNYMKHAFPEDELNPIDCCGRGADHENP